MSLVFDSAVANDTELAALGLPDARCWLDPGVPRATDGAPRRQHPTAIVLHTVHGRRGPLSTSTPPASTRAEAYARYQARTARDVSWHYTVDIDSTVVQSADPIAWTCWHAGHANAWTIGIELVQEADGTLYVAQLATLVSLVSLLCARCEIPRRVPLDAAGASLAGVVPAWQSVAAGGRAVRWSGVIGHRNLTRSRGSGDPGDHPFAALLRAGFEGVVV